MQGFLRYAIYYAPEPGPLAEFAAHWLGWDADSGAAMAHPLLTGLPREVGLLTQAPRKYGFHGTVKPPFRLAEGADVSDLHAAFVALCPYLAPVTLPGLRLERIGGFVALTPEGDQGPLAAMAAEVVRALDGFRAPPDATEIARRRPERLSPRQRGYLADWGYPYVMEEFRFHLTLTGDLPEAEAAQVEAVLGPVLQPLLPQPFRIGSLCLFGEAADGRFRLLERVALTG
ncbi:phosphonate metabolism protein [Cereibacter changlensis JA139]|uniref:Phosphonate metabolism protein n=2 Tax=Cereibacter changlensis TaxID=402884 RepID=A0A2T4JU70_9RHOB|nr:DUF1045 domain-containing protein [Cereibacter changlensis]PTE21462.1 phosphonate metabolism protein [Cereibacter changlensis JA139]PZX57133.1 putative phosphonate metabolism protein [Cereibacter changlensis]